MPWFFIQITLSLGQRLGQSQLLGSPVAGLLGLLTRVPSAQTISNGERQPGFWSLFVTCVSKTHVFS